MTQKRVVDKTLTLSLWTTLKWTMPLKFSDYQVKKLSESGSTWGQYTGKTDLKLDSLSFLTLITKFQRHSPFKGTSYR